MNKQYPQEVFTWMITSMQTVPLYYGVMPVKELYKVFQSGKDEFPGRDGAPGIADISEKEYIEMLRQLLSIANRPEVAGTPGLAAAGITCKFDGDEIISNDPAAEDLVKTIRAEKKKLPVKIEDYRILTYEEVMQVLMKGYVETPETTAFENYLRNKRKKSEEEAVDIVRHTVIGFRTNEDDPQEAMNELAYTLGANTPQGAMTPEEMMEMVNAITAVYQVTGQMNRNGWSPNEMHEKIYGTKAPEVKGVLNMDSGATANASPLASMGLGNLKPGSTVVPESSHMAKILKEHEAELEKMGITVDYEAAAGRYSSQRVTPEGTTQRTRSQKVYRNDPCPCGSGLKYKNCHGRG